MLIKTRLILYVLLSSHSAPCRREVRVHFLDPMPLHSVGNLPDAPALSSRDAAKDAGVQMETPLSSGHLGDASSTAAAAAAAALAAAAPLFKVSTADRTINNLIDLI